jgi:hypothetical protein
MENGPAKTERTRRSRAEIAELIATYRQSGQKQREFCQQRGIGLSTLQNYLRQNEVTGSRNSNCWKSKLYRRQRRARVKHWR